MWYRGEIEEAEPLANNTSHESKKKRERHVQGSSNCFPIQEKLNCFYFERKELQVTGLHALGELITEMNGE